MLTLSFCVLPSLLATCFAYGQTGSGKCWAPGSMLLLASGAMKSVESIEAGDELMGDDHTVRVVQAGSVIKGESLMYQIAHPSGRRDNWSVNGEHILVLRLDTTPFLTSSPSHTDSSAAFTVSRYSVIDGRPARQDFLHTDSFTSAQDRCEELTRTSAVDANVFECTVEEYLSFPSPLRDACDMFQPTGPIEFTESILPREENLEASWNNGYALTIDETHMCGSITMRRALLAGMIDAAGKVASSEDGFDLSLDCSSIATSAVRLSRSLGLVSWRTSESVCVRGSALHEVAPYLRHASLPAGVPSKSTDDEMSESFTITPMSHGAYHGFTVTGNGRLLMADFLVSHNTFTMLGNGEESGPGMGLYAMAARDVFSLIAASGPRYAELQVFCSYYESQKQHTHSDTAIRVTNGRPVCS